MDLEVLQVKVKTLHFGYIVDHHFFFGFTIPSNLVHYELRVTI